MEFEEDFLNVGKTKAVGWLAVSDKQYWINYARKHNLSYSIIHNNSFYLYDPIMLQKLLDKYKKKIKHILPLTPKKYINFIKSTTIINTEYYNSSKHFLKKIGDNKFRCELWNDVFIVDDEVYKFIGITFNDKRFTEKDIN